MLKKKKKSAEIDEPSEADDLFFLSPAAKVGILVTALLAIAAIAALSLLGLADPFGFYLGTGLRLAFGRVHWVFPLILLCASYSVLRGYNSSQRGWARIMFQVLSSFGMLCAISGLFHVFADQSSVMSNIRQGGAGGYVGFAVGYPLYRFWGLSASAIILASIILIFLFIIFDRAVIAFFVFLQGALKTALASRMRFSKWHSRSSEQSENISTPQFVQEIETKESAFKDKNAQLEEGAKEGESEAVKVPFFRRALMNRKGNGAVQADAHESHALVPRTARKIDLPLNLLYTTSDKPTPGNLKQNKEIIKETLASFHIPVEMGDVHIGPTVTQYCLLPLRGVKLARIVALQRDLSLALAARHLRIEAPIPGKSLVGIEIPNETSAIVSLHEILSSAIFKNRDSSLSLALGKDVSGHPHIASIETMPHVLIAGATGAGKSVMINAIIVSLLYQNSPDDLKLILVDPKRVELSIYNDIPHLLTPVVVDIKKIINALRWCVSEMERRYELLSEYHKRNIASYNKTAEEKLPYIVFIIDEMADLMSSAGKDVEALVVRLAQMSRAVGIHLVLATQRPSVDVITGLIKANMPFRIAFAVASQIDSRTILDISGAEKLLGRGDMLYLGADLGKPRRLQAPFVSEEEVKNVVRRLKEQALPEYVLEVTQKHSYSEGLGVPVYGDFLQGGETDDDLYEQAREIVVKYQKASASMLQRYLRVGYARAARLIDLLENRGVIGAGDGAKPREVLAGGGDVVYDGGEEVEDHVMEDEVNDGQ